jgi:zinc protease
LEQPQTGAFITSGHATQRDWQIGFRYPNGHWDSSQGKLISVDLAGKKREIQSPHPKVYLAVGNCLIGHVNGPDAMALAYFNNVGVRQMVGYTLPTWYGYQGWGLLDYFIEQPGRYSLAEAFLANQLALVNRLETYFPEIAREDSDSAMGRISKPIPLSAAAKAAGLSAQDANGLMFDRDVVAFYGDPAWDARLAPGKLQWQQTWQQDPAGGSLEITPLAGAATFAPVNTNGSQRGGRPIIQFFDQRIDPASVVITAGAEFKPVIADDFLLIPLPAADKEPQKIKVTFTAKLLK